MKKKNCILGEEEDLKKRRDKIVSGGKEKIFDENGGRNRWVRKKGRKKIIINLVVSERRGYDVGKFTK